MRGDKRGPYFNASGYPDPTAYQVIKTITAEETADAEARQRVTRVMYVIKAVVELAGFELADRVAITDKQTGRVFR